ncbi:site-specific integrase [Alkalihalobacillus sp. LMS6]|jgi:site-specific recombinase XerD|uniref:tyrosine-type recombinase/integrase n=1 Tax=Alkalihalobacillus sp. LMS6 TaxID=2924034 RepID=UPI0020D0D3B1|nr:site-specific integrase [Alkalihalobacillus sp. LMS6]UTR05214.1 site-specific integrase [Alkalihalobacillus sp. LMS6]
MSKKKASLSVSEDLSDVFTSVQRESFTAPETKQNGITVNQALMIIVRQMKASGKRPRTISDYETYVNQLINYTGIMYVADVGVNTIYEWLSKMEVSNQTKLTRLKCIKAFLGKCFDNGWVEAPFWKQIKIKADIPVKEGAVDRDIELLLSLLDLGDFVQLRDATAVMVLYKTGIRISTLSALEERHVDLEDQLLKLDGGVLKNHEQLFLPFNDTLKRLFTVLIKQNDLVRREYGVHNSLIFITSRGTQISTSQSHNNIQKQLHKYSKKFGIKNLNPHALRRGYAKNLLKRGVDVATISRALGHSGLDVTTRYLHLDKEEIVDKLRGYV